MSFSTEKLAELVMRFDELKARVGDDTPETIAKSCNNPFNDDDAHAMALEYDLRMSYYEELQEAKSRLDEYLTQYD